MAHVLNVPHFQQAVDGFCLPACAQMVLAYLGIEHSQKDLASRLGTRPIAGTPYSRVTRLVDLGLDVTYKTNADLKALAGHIERGAPVIVPVQTVELPYWNGHASRHTIVVIGMDETGRTAQVLDPALSSPDPIPVPLGDLLLAWDEMENAYAVLSRRSEKPGS